MSGRLFGNHNHNQMSEGDFREAAAKGDLVAVQRYIQENQGNQANLDLASQAGSTALIRAAANGRTECVTALINNGANLDLAEILGSTALILAAANGRTDCVTALINNGANLDLASQAGSTALIRAAARGHTECVTALINAGANLSLTNNNGQTAAQAAEICGHRQLAALLREAEPRAKAANEAKEMDYLVSSGKYEAAIETAIKAQAEGKPETLWKLAEKLYELIGSRVNKSATEEKIASPDFQVVLHCFELVSSANPLLYANACSRRAEMMELAKIVVAEEKDSFDDYSEKIKVMREERLSLAVAGFKGDPYHSEIAYMVADRVYHAMEGRDSSLPPEINISDDQAKTLISVSEIHLRERQSLQKTIAKQNEIIFEEKSENSKLYAENSKLHEIIAEQNKIISGLKSENPVWKPATFFVQQNGSTNPHQPKLKRSNSFSS